MSIEEQKRIGDKIREARFISKLSQKKLAKKIGVGIATISRMELGATTAKFSDIKKIAEVTGKDMDFFLEEPKEKPESTPEKYIDVTGVSDRDIELLKQMADRMKDKEKTA